MANDISELRGHLFGMLQDLREPGKTVDVERYRLANEMAQTVINSAKVEVEFMRVAGGNSKSGFIPHEGKPGALPPGNE